MFKRPAFAKVGLFTRSLMESYYTKRAGQPDDVPRPCADLGQDQATGKLPD